MKLTPLIVVVAVIFSLSWGQAAVAAAEGPLLAAAKAAGKRLDVRPELPRPLIGGAVAGADRAVAHPVASPSAQVGASGSRKGLKVALAIGAAAVAFAASAYAIDQSVENITPSSLGTRTD